MVMITHVARDLDGDYGKTIRHGPIRGVCLESTTGEHVPNTDAACVFVGLRPCSRVCVRAHMCARIRDPSEPRSTIVYMWLLCE